MTLRQKIDRDALAARRAMVRNGELVRESEFCTLLGLSPRRLARMIARGSVFAMEVDGVSYIPTLLAKSGIDRKRLFSICRILVPAPPSCRLGYLACRQANVGGIFPIDALHDDESYRLLRRMARAYAAEWWRTSVAIYEGSHLDEPSSLKPILTAVDDGDPRVNVWKRAAGAIQAGGYIEPCGPYPNVSLATVFVGLHPAGQASATVQARVEVRVKNGLARASVVRGKAPAYDLEPIQIDDKDSVVDVVLRIIAVARTRK